MTIDISERGPALVVSLSGTVGMVELEHVDGELARLADRKPKLVVLELSRVSVMGSCVMGSLVGFRRDVASGGGVVNLAAVPPAVRESFRRAMLDRLFKIYDSVQAAINL
jgi:anti-sigma B factor antagonist